MRFGLMNTKVYAKEFTLNECAPGEMEICIENGSIDIDISHMVKDLRKSDREKVWEMIKNIYHPIEAHMNPDPEGMPVAERSKVFGTDVFSKILSMPVDEVLEKYESWKKKHDAEAAIKSLKPQDVVAYNSGIDFDYRILMITRVIALDGKRYTFDGITRDGRSTVIYISIDDSKFTVKKIGRVVETTDILGEIKKIEDEWRKNR